MKKVYLVIYNTICHYETIMDVFVFDSLEKAKNKMKSLVPQNYNCDTKESGDNYFEFYNEGWYEKDRISCVIREKEVK